MPERRLIGIKRPFTKRHSKLWRPKKPIVAGKGVLRSNKKQAMQKAGSRSGMASFVARGKKPRK